MITGSIVALVTPMHPDGSLDWGSLERLLDMHIAAGTSAIGAVGTTGESATLSVPEHLEVIRHCVRYVNGRIPVVAGTGANSTREAIELTSVAARNGADACLLVTPYYNRPTQRGLYEHFKAIAAADNIVGIKDATGDLSRVPDFKARCPDDFAIYSGDDPTAMELMLAGGHGNVSVTANIAPRQLAELCRLALAGERAEAAQINERLSGLNRALFLEANPIPVKWAMQQRGLIEAGIRLPLTPLDERFHAQVLAALEAAGI